LSVIIGLVLVGLAFLLQGSVQTFGAVLAAQVVWGVGQVAGGPPLGALTNRTSLGTALVTSAVILSPTALLYLRLRPTRKDADADAGTSAAGEAGH
jgi:hypothetical protein